MTPEISVIVPVYNAGQWLRRCVDSILGQTFTDFELLLIDDGSTDDSAAICDEYAARAPRVRVFHKPNGGVSSARNLGLDHARGAWIAFVDADDWIDNIYLEELLRAGESANADIVLCDLYLKSEISASRFDQNIWDSNGQFSLAKYIDAQWNPICCNIHRRKLYEKGDKLRFDTNVSHCEDFQFMIKLLCRTNNVSKVNSPNYFYWQHDSSTLHTLTESDFDSQIKAYQETVKFLDACGHFNVDVERSMAWRLFFASHQYLTDSNRFQDFRTINSVNKKYLNSCPNLSLKLKIIAWFVLSNLNLPARMILSLWKLHRKK